MTSKYLPLAGLLLVSACASQASRDRLDYLENSCRGGDTQSCSEVPQQQAENAAEAQQNGQEVGSVLLGVLGAVAAVAAASGGYYSQPTVVTTTYYRY
jgi:hypothetical protein